MTAPQRTPTLEQNRTDFSPSARLLSLFLLIAIVVAPPFDEINANTLKAFVLYVGAALSLLVMSQSRSALMLAIQGAKNWRSAGNWIQATALLMLGHALVSSASTSLVEGTAETLRWALFLGIFWVARHAGGANDAECTLARLGQACTLVALLGLGQFYFGLDLFAQAAAPASTFVNRNFAAEIVACLLWAQWFSAQRAGSFIGVSAGGIQVGLSLVYLVTTGTRSAILVTITLLASNMLWMFWRSLRHSNGNPTKAWAILGWGLATMLALAPVTSNTIEHKGEKYHDLLVSKFSSTQTTDGATSGSVRMELLQSTWSMTKDHFPLGVGAGNLGNKIIGYQTNLGGYEIEDHTHNEYLQWAAEYGLIGFLFSGALLAACLRALVHGIQSPSRTGDQPKSAEATYLTLMLMALIGVMLAGFPTQLVCGLGLLALITGLLARMEDAQKDTPTITIRSAGTTEKSLWMLCTAAAMLIGFAVSQSEWRLNTARKIAVQVQTYLSGMTESMEKYRIEASELALSALPLAKWNHRSLVPTADELASIGEFETAKILYESAIAARPNTPGLWVSLAKIADIKNDDATAKTYIAKSLLLQKDNLPAMTFLANKEAQRGDSKTAQSMFEFLLGLDKSMSTNYDLGYRISEDYFHDSCESFARKSKNDQILGHCRGHKAKYSENGFRVYAELAYERWQQKQDGAIELFAKGLKTTPKKHKQAYLDNIPKMIRDQVIELARN